MKRRTALTGFARDFRDLRDLMDMPLEVLLIEVPDIDGDIDFASLGKAFSI
jgi:hypothetical protein